MNLSWGFGVTFGVFIAGSVTGNATKQRNSIFMHVSREPFTAGFINPAITLVSAIRGRISVSKCLVYMLAEYLGAFFGAAIVYGIYSSKKLPTCTRIKDLVAATER